MKVRRQQQSSILSSNRSQKQTLKTVQSLGDLQTLVHDNENNQKYVLIHDEEVLHLISSKNYAQASIILHELVDRIEDDYHLKQQMVKTFRLYVCFYNLGVLSWRLKRFQDAEKFLQKAIHYLDMNLNFCKFKEEHLVFSLELIKLQLQHSVVLSQNGKHWKAADIGDRSINRLFQCFNIKMEMVKEMLTSFKINKKAKKQKGVDFKKIVLADAKQKLKHLSEFQKSYRLIEQSSDELHEIINSLYTWKRNFENNEKFIRMSLNIQKETMEGQRNILGISKLPEWIQFFNIGTLMTLQPRKMDFSPNLDTFYILSTNKILQLVLYTSVAYFTVATQIRFKELQTDNKCMSPSQKFLKMNDNSKIQKCKILHLKAIQLVARFIPSGKTFISHLVSSFNKNYKFYMDKIEQESSYLIEAKVIDKRDASGRKKMKSSKKKKSKSKKRRINSVSKGESLEHFSKTKNTQISIQQLKYSLPTIKKYRK